MTFHGYGTTLTIEDSTPARPQMLEAEFQLEDEHHEVYTYFDRAQCAAIIHLLQSILDRQT